MIKYLLEKIFLLSFFATLLVAVDAHAVLDKSKISEEEELKTEFQGTKFLQIDQLDLPKELKKIEEQIKQNALDVVISSKTHTPVYAQKMSDGYSKSYTNFHGLEIKIIPISNDQDFYSLSFLYYNWTTRKYDKKLHKRISKYNVLNELRFGLYELLLGKNFITEHKDEIEKQNYDRIQAVRENETNQERIERRKKKELKKKEEERSLKEDERINKKIKREELNKKENEKVQQDADSIEESQQSSGLSPEESLQEFDINNEKNDPARLSKLTERNSDKKINKTLALANKSEQPNDENILDAKNEVLAEDIEKKIPSLSSFYGVGNYFSDVVISDGYLHTTTQLTYIGFGARYIQEKQETMPSGMRFTLKVGLPIKKDDYSFPVYRNFESEVYKRNIFGDCKFLVGFDFSPLYFANLANPGDGIVVFENDLFWLKGGISLSQNIFEKRIELRGIYLKSLLGKSNVKKSIEGTSLVLTGSYQHSERHGLEISYYQTEMVGDLAVTSKKLDFSYIYKFEN